MSALQDFHTERKQNSEKTRISWHRFVDQVLLSCPSVGSRGTQQLSAEYMYLVILSTQHFGIPRLWNI